MRLAVSLLCSCCFSVSALAHPEKDTVDEIVVHGRAIDLLGDARSGSEGVVGYSDFDKRPLSRVGELIEVIPGLVATQHSGSGKSNQIFLRGFNLDHGTDFAAFFDGTPVNFRTHGHGQGYLDLNFIIPEIVERIDFRKGPYYADVGDFSAAGTAAFKTYDELVDGIAQVTIGEAGYRRGLAANSFHVGESGVFLLAGEAVFNDSPYVLEEDFEKYNIFTKFTREGDASILRLSLSFSDASWNSTDQVPQRAIDSGLIPRLGFIDEDLGGDTRRIALNAQFEANDFEFSTYALYYDLSLFSNFTYFANDPVNGDEFEQRDERFLIGGSGSKTWQSELAGRPTTIRVGGDVRYDDIFNIGLFNTVARERINTVRDDNVSELSVAGFADVEVQITDRLRASGGLRADVYRYDVVSSLPQNTGDGSDAIVTPTAALAWQASDVIEFYANYGQGFHSNDVRGAAISVDPVTLTPVDPVDVLVRAEGAEIGMRFNRQSFSATVVGFWLDLDGELVFVGDAGTTEPNGATRRFGVEFNGFWRPSDWLTVDASAAYTDASFINEPATADRIPQAVETVVGAGATVEVTPELSATLRLRHFGKAPLVEDGSVFSEPTTIVNMGAYYDIGPARLSLDVLNLLNSKDADITYFFESQLAGEALPVEDVHLHPVEPRQIRGSIRVAF